MEASTAQIHRTIHPTIQERSPCRPPSPPGSTIRTANPWNFPHCHGVRAVLQRRVLQEQSAQELFETLNEIGPLHRSARNTHTALQQARELMVDDTDIIDLRDHAEQIERTLELLRHEAKNALDYRVAVQAEHESAAAHAMNVAAHRLTILAAVFFPLVTLTGSAISASPD